MYNCMLPFGNAPHKTHENSNQSKECQSGVLTTVMLGFSRRPGREEQEANVSDAG